MDIKDLLLHENESSAINESNYFLQKNNQSTQTHPGYHLHKS